MSYLPDRLPPPEVDGEPDARFWRLLRDHRLCVQRCESCAAVQHPPGWLCRRCQSSATTFVDVRPTGTVFSWTRVWHATHPALADAVPYRVVVVSLRQYPHIRLVGNLVGEPLEDITIGAPVDGVFEDHDGYTLLQWRARAEEQR